MLESLGLNLNIVTQFGFKHDTVTSKSLNLMTLGFLQSRLQQRFLETIVTKNAPVTFRLLCRIYAILLNNLLRGSIVVCLFL